MARYDKYDPISGGYRARLAAPLALTNGSFFGGISLNASGRVVAGSSGQTGITGVVVKNVAKGPLGPYFTDTKGGVPNPYAPVGAQTGDVVDIMTSGEIVDLDPTVFVAGTKFYAAADGSITTTATSNKLIGWTVEAGRLIVRVAAATAA